MLTYPRLCGGFRRSQDGRNHAHRTVYLRVPGISGGNEKARATVEKYVQEAEQLRLALCGAPVTKAGVLAYRERLQQQYRL